MLFDTESKRLYKYEIKNKCSFFQVNPPIHMNYPVKTKELIKIHTLIKFL